MKRPLWTYRPLLCMLGWHAYSVQRRASLQADADSGTHRTVWQLVATCDRLGCTKAKVVS